MIKLLAAWRDLMNVLFPPDPVEIARRKYAEDTR